MPGRGLLSRLAAPGTSPGEVEAILEHLRVLLNTRLGSAPSAPRYGVMDLSDVVHAFPEAAQVLVRSIRATLIEHEPRLEAVAVRHVTGEGELTLRFEISAQLAGPRARAVRFFTTVRPGGRFDVAG